jgi:hypothetical protein
MRVASSGSRRRVVLSLTILWAANETEIAREIRIN